MDDKKPFTIELEETTPIPHSAEVEQISDVSRPAKISMSSGRGLGLLGWAVSLGVSLLFAYLAIGFWDFVLAQCALQVRQTSGKPSSFPEPSVNFTSEKPCFA